MRRRTETKRRRLARTNRRLEIRHSFPCTRDLVHGNQMDFGPALSISCETPRHY